MIVYSHSIAARENGCPTINIAVVIQLYNWVNNTAVP